MPIISLDTEEKKRFTDLADLTSLICDCPVSMITFIDQDRQWFKARKNLAEPQTPISMSLWAKVVQDDRSHR